MEEAILAERIGALDDLEEDTGLEDDEDFEDGASLSPEFYFNSLAVLVLVLYHSICCLEFRVVFF